MSRSEPIAPRIPSHNRSHKHRNHFANREPRPRSVALPRFIAPSLTNTRSRAAQAVAQSGFVANTHARDLTSVERERPRPTLTAMNVRQNRVETALPRRGEEPYFLYGDEPQRRQRAGIARFMAYVQSSSLFLRQSFPLSSRARRRPPPPPAPRRGGPSSPRFLRSSKVLRGVQAACAANTDRRRGAPPRERRRRRRRRRHPHRSRHHRRHRGR